MMKYEVTGKVVGMKKGDVVVFDRELPRAYKGRVRALPADLEPKRQQGAQGNKK